MMARLHVLALALLLAACASTPEQGDPAELTKFPVERELNLLWSHHVGNGQGGSYLRLVPAAKGDMLYVASAGGDLLAMNAVSGDVLWKRDLDEPISGAVGLDEQRLLLGTAEGEVLALDPQNGKRLWSQKLTGEVLAPPQSDGHTVVVQTYDGYVVGLSAEDGKTLWSYAATVPRLTLRGTSTPVLAGDVVVAGLANGRVVALDLRSGALRWELRVSVPKGSTEIERLSDVDGRLLVDGGQLFAVGYQGKIVAVDIRSGRRLWDRDISSYVGPAAGYGNVYAVTTDGTVNAYQQNGQGVVWSQTVLANRKLTAPAILSGSLIVGDYKGYLHALSQVDGHLVGREQLDSSGLRAPLLVHDNVLYAYANNGTLAAYQFASAAERGGRANTKRHGPRH